MKRLFCVMVISLCAFASRAAECFVTLGASDAGWYNAAGFHDPDNVNYFAGYNGSSGAEFRDWFVFNLPPFTNTVTAVTLRLATFEIQSTNASATLELHQVAAPISVLTNGGTGLANVFNDLGDGAVYGTRTILVSEMNSFISIVLNSNAIAAIAAAGGQRFAIGGRVSSIPPGSTNDHSLFGYSYGSATNVQLVVSFASTNAPMVVSQPPTNYFTASGSSIKLTVEACGAAPLRYQWFFNGAAIANQTNAMLNLANVNANMGGNYFAVVTNSLGAATSSVTKVFVDARLPTILALNYSSQVLVGESISIGATVDGLPFPALRWQFNGTDIPGATNATLLITNAALTNAGTYTILASNVYGMTRRDIVITIEPFLIYGPYDTQIPSGADGYVAVSISTMFLPAYQWRLNGTNIPGATAASLPFFNASLSVTGNYDVVVSTLLGTRTSAVARVSVAGTAPQLYGPLSFGPLIVDMPFALSVNVSGSSPFRLQWYFNGAPIPSATNAQIGFDNAAANQAGNYYLVASNAFGVVTSTVAGIFLTPLSPQVLVTSNSMRAFAGDARVLLASVLSAPRPDLQWRFNGIPIGGATNASLLLTHLSVADAGLYTCTATNTQGSNGMTTALEVLPKRALDSWTWRNPRPQANDLEHIAFGNGRYVVGGEGGALATSTDGLNWTAVPLGNRYSIDGMAFGNGTFAAIVRQHDPSREMIFTSTNGLEWVPHALLDFESITTIAFANGQFQAFGSSVDGVVRRAVSTSGNAWNSSIAVGLDYKPASVAYGSATFVAASYLPYASTDGTHFTLEVIPANGFKRIGFGNGRFVAVGYTGGLWTSTNGVRWLQCDSHTVAELDGIAYGNNRFVAVGDDGTVLVSTDGLIWNLFDPGTSKNLKDVLFDGTQFVLCGNDGVLLSSSDGAIWTDRRGGKTKDLYGIAYTNGLFVAVGYDGTILTSGDGVSWTTRTSPNSRDLHAVTYAAGQFVAVGRKGTVLTSPNGISWTSRPTPTTNYLERITYGNGRYVAVGSAATIVSSTNGINWELHVNSADTNTELEGIAFGKGLFVAAGGYFTNLTSGPAANGVILVSSNGMDWLQVVDGGTDKILRGVAFAENYFRVVGNDGLTMFSTNGLDWFVPVNTVQFVPPYQNLRNIRYAAGRFVAVGNGGAVVSFRDFWTEHGSIVSENLHDVAYGAGKFVAVGNAGTIVQSDDAVPVFSGVTPSNGSIQFTLRGGMEPQYRIQTTRSLGFSWQDVDVFTNNGAAAAFTKGATNTTERYYRTIAP